MEKKPMSLRMQKKKKSKDDVDAYISEGIDELLSSVSDNWIRKAPLEAVLDAAPIGNQASQLDLLIGKLRGSERKRKRLKDYRASML